MVKGHLKDPWPLFHLVSPLLTQSHFGFLRAYQHFWVPGLETCSVTLSTEHPTLWEQPPLRLSPPTSPQLQDLIYTPHGNQGFLGETTTSSWPAQLNDVGFLQVGAEQSARQSLSEFRVKSWGKNPSAPLLLSFPCSSSWGGGHMSAVLCCLSFPSPSYFPLSTIPWKEGWWAASHFMMLYLLLCSSRSWSFAVRKQRFLL